MEPTKIQSAGYNITYIAQPGENGPRVLWDIRSPFDANATAIIKAAFPDQWGAIAAYGKAHPEIVPYVNANPLCVAIWCGYKQSGLVFQMDCDYECSAALWKDVRQAIEFTGTNVQLTDGVPTFNGSARYVSDSNNLYSYNTHTIEIVFHSADGSGSFQLLFYPDGDSLGAGRESSSHLLCKVGSAISSPYAPVTYGIFDRVSFNKERCAVNGQIVSKVGSNDGWNTRGTGKTFIGARNTENYYTGRIYAIRIYDHLLTEAEILANQAIDLQRWGDA